MKKYLIGLSICLLSLPGMAQDTWKGKGWNCLISEKGYLEQIVFEGENGNDTIPFFHKDENSGPAFYAVMEGEKMKASWSPDGYRSFRAEIEEVECRMTYKEWKGCPALEVKLLNKGNVPFQPEKAGLQLGVDTYMDQYPDWFGKFFPTLMRNEKTHFYGYMQTPSGNILGIVSPQSIASWSVEYNLGYQDPPPHWFMGHRIESLNLDLLNTLPLPERNPQNLWQLRQGESKTWLISFVNIKQLSQLEQSMYEVSGCPMLRMERTNYMPGETAVFDVLAKNADIGVYNDRGEKLAVEVKSVSNDVSQVSCMLPEVGLYTVRVKEKDRETEGILSAHASWKWVLEQARIGALVYHQKATSHIESWYGFHSAFLAAKYFPDKEIDRPLRNRFDYLFTLLHDTVRMVPNYYASRIQNTSGTIGMLVDKYQAYGDVKDLENASRLADWLILNNQREDGAYVNHNTVYTSVIYVAKSLLELTLAEKKLSVKDSLWHERAERHYLSAKKAIDQLVNSQGNFETEGEMTFEDGMISCSALQIGMLGLMQVDENLRKHYTQAMLQILNSHDCLTQLKVPDARRRGGTMRYWEAQYDVQMLPNMFNSPHGWSGWRAYATYYAYLLTGDERWLLETYNAMGAFSHLIDYQTGRLRWAFVVDPFLKVKQACSADTHVTQDSLSFGNPHPELYKTRNFIIGEQYVNMISDWQTVNTQDNDVHEVFKCLGETMLTNAFIVERKDGTLVGYNCEVYKNNNQLHVKASESQIINLHCNLKNGCQIRFNGQTKVVDSNYLGWLFGTNIYQ